MSTCLFFTSNPQRHEFRRSTAMVVGSLISFALALCGCEKVPTFQELTGQESKPVAAANPVPPDQPAAVTPPVQTPVVAAPARIEDPQEVLSAFMKIPHHERSDADLIRLAKLPAASDSITEMDCASAKGVTDAGIQHLAKFPNIEHLSLAGTRVTQVGMSAVSSLTRLKSLDLRGCVLNHEMLIEMVKAEHIERLVLSQTTGGEDYLETLSSLPDLRVLDISLRGISDNNLTSLANCLKLEELYLQRDPIDGSGLQFLHSKKGPPLRILNVSSTRFGDKGMPYLKGLDTLEELIADDCGITDQALLQHLKGLSHLRKLSLGLNKISDIGTQALVSIKSLEDVSFHGCTNVGDKTLGYLKAHKNLRQLNVMGCRISPAALQTFKKLLPDCEVTSN